MGIKTMIKQSPTLSRLSYNALYSYQAIKQNLNHPAESKILKTLRNSHRGERCFIIGTGPSLTISDLELLKNETTFATNRIYELFDQTDWRPTYYVNQDHNLISTFADRINTVSKDAKLSFLPVEYKDHFPGERFRFFVLRHKEFYPHAAPFSRDISKYLAQGFTVTYGAIQIAVYMGFTEIYLLGIDHNYTVFRDASGRPVKNTSSQGNYSKGMKEYININNLPRIEETTIAYETAASVSSKCGFVIYNATRGGKLEAFERRRLEDILEGAQ